jgi:polar amino acid transport system substrate-binding protein
VRHLTVRRFFAVAAIVALTGALAACGDDDSGGDDSGSGSDSGSEDSGLDLITDNTLTIGTNLPAPGFWNGDDPAAITGGFEYELGVAIAEELGLSDGVEVVNVAFDALIAGQATGFDVAFSQVTIGPERAAVVDFTDAYYESDLGILALEGEPTPDADEAKALQWGVQIGTTSLDYLNDTLQPDQEPQVYQETTQAFAALQAGQVDAVLLDTAIVLQQAAASDGLFEVVGQFDTPDQYGGVIAKDSPSFDAINDALAGLIADGTVAELAIEWLGGDPADIPFVEV